jgi:hypothetical protein
MMILDFKNNLNEIAKEMTENFFNVISQNKKQLHQRAADIIKEDIKEHYDEEFEKVVDPNSTWQQLKESLGFSSRPGHFTESTLRALVAEASEELGEVMLKGRWPTFGDQLFSDELEIEPFGIRIKPVRNETTGRWMRSFFIPGEDFSTKQYGSWIDEDIVFMKLRMGAEREVMTSLEREIQKMFSNFLGRANK